MPGILVFYTDCFVGALSFPFDFQREEDAAEFVRQVARSIAPVPCLRDGRRVYVVIAIRRDIDDLLEIAKELDGRPRLR